MKFLNLTAFCLVALLASTAAVCADKTQTNGQSAVVSALGPNYRVWTITHTNKAQEKSATHRATAQHRVMELGTGMHYWNGKEWTPSEPSFEVTATGFEATHTQHKVHLNRDISFAGAVNVTTRDGILLHSTPLGIGLYDAASGNFLLIGQITNSTGVLVASNQVVYPNAFNGVCADVAYTMERGRFHQDVVFTGQVDPGAYGFPRETTRIQILTEFYDSPSPRIRQHTLKGEKNADVRKSMASPDLTDQTLGFGEFVLGPGSAYLGQTNTAANQFSQLGASVGKAFIAVNNRRLLVESVDYKTVSNQLQTLPHCNNGVTASSKLSIQKADVAYALLPVPQRGIQSASAGTNEPSVIKSAQVAGSQPDAPQLKNKPTANLTNRATTSAARPGFVMDYVATVGGSMDDDFTFQSDTTYFASSIFSCNGNITLEGGAVLKYGIVGFTDMPVNSGIIVMGNVNCQGSSYRPTIMTASDDDTVGESLSGVDPNYTGNPAGTYYGDSYLSCIYLQSLNNLRISFADNALTFGEPPYSPIFLNNVQFINCDQCVFNVGGDGVTPFTLNNCLMANNRRPFYDIEDSQEYILNQCTFDGDDQFNTFLGGTAAFFATNCIFANLVDDWTTYPNPPNGDFNGFYNTTAFGSDIQTIMSSPFQSVGAGNYYLAPSSFQGLGTTNIDPLLLAELAQMTTYPPTVIVSSNISADLTLSPLVTRDTNTSLDLGYHYDAIDYAMGAVLISNATLNVTAGTVIATFDTNASGDSLSLGPSGQLICLGSPNNLCRIVNFNTVQESAAGVWQTPSDSLVKPSYSAEITCRFTDFSMLAQDTSYFFNTAALSGPPTLQDCQVHGGMIFICNTLDLTNCLLDRVNMVLIGFDGNILTIRNALFIGGYLELDSYYTNAVVQNNLFDGTAIADDGGTVGGWNAYVTNCNQLATSYTNDVILTNSLCYQRSWFGHYYQPTNSPLLNVGSTNANLLGLYHYTTQTNQVEQRDSKVDIGYHYVAVDGSGNPIDVNSNGIPDYLENPNGPVPPNIVLQPATQTANADDDVTFTVVAYGESPLTYQWTFNGTNLPGATASSFTTNNVQVASAGDYAVLINTPGGNTNSSDAVLTVLTPTVATPVINPSGQFVNFLAISVTCATPDASIFYTTNNVDPTTNDISTISGAVITIIDGVTIKAKAFKNSWTPSSVTTQQFHKTNVQVAAGNNHALVLLPDTTVVSWGDNTYGQLGQGITGTFNDAGGIDQPYPIPNLTNVTAICASYNSSLALKSDGSVWWWGGTYLSGAQPVPTQVDGVSNIVAIGLNYNTAFAVDTNGSVWFWGFGAPDMSSGQWPPAQLEGLTNVTAVSAGNPTRLAMTADGNVYTWTEEWSGTPDSSELTQLTSLSNITAIVVADFSHSMALRSDGTVWTWGYNDDGQLGDGTTTDRPDPIEVPGISNIVAISGNSFYLPRFVGGASIDGISDRVSRQCSDLSAYEAHSLALRVDGSIFAWGSDEYGQLGDGTGDDSYSPIQVVNITNTIAISAGPIYSLAVGADLWAYVWGSNSTALQGLGSENDSPVQFRVYNVGDPDGDGIPTWLELLDGTDPNDYYNAVLPTLTKSNDNQFGAPGTYLPTPLTLLITGTNGQPLSNAPVVLNVFSGDAVISSNLLGPTNQTLLLLSTSNGIIQIFVTLSTNPLVTNAITATATSESATNGTNSVTVAFTATSLDLDIDYDSISDSHEIADGTDPLNSTNYVYQRLGYWDFDTTNGAGERGQLPVNNDILTLVRSWRTNCVQINATNSAPLTYHDVERDSTANINLRHGTIRFWFQPNWETTSYASLICEGPGSIARFVEMGQQTSDASNGWWGLTISPDGSQINFGAQSNGISTNYLTCSVSFASNQWHQIALTYGESNSALYFDGQLAATGSAVTIWPNLQVRSSGGFTIGSDGDGSRGAAGQFEELEIFNYPLAATNIDNDYSATLTAAVPSAPTNLTFTVLSATVVSLSWTAGSTNQDSFVIEKSVGTNGTFLPIAQVSWNQYNYIDFNMAMGLPNLYRVRAQNIGGQSLPSNVVNTFADSNGDGLSDFVEAEFGLNPAITDNDGDGLPDAWEILYGLNPLSAVGNDGAAGDPNQDGISNLIHYETGTNPTANTLQGTNTIINLIIYQPLQ